MKSPACLYGAAGARHACTGCTCDCHNVPPPPNFRALVHRAREHATAPNDDDPEAT
jgi:hypothetical protein